MRCFSPDSVSRNNGERFLFLKNVLNTSSMQCSGNHCTETSHTPWHVLEVCSSHSSMLAVVEMMCLFSTRFLALCLSVPHRRYLTSSARGADAEVWLWTPPFLGVHRWANWSWQPASQLLIKINLSVFWNYDCNMSRWRGYENSLLVSAKITSEK